MGTSAIQQAEVLGAGIIIVALERPRADADSRDTMVSSGAGIGVVAKGGVGAIVAARNGVTTVVCANIAIIAVLGSTGGTRACLADIGEGADVAVLARNCVVQVLAASVRVAAVISAKIAVVTVGRDSGQTDTFDAEVTDGAGIAIVTGKTLVVRDQGTLARDGVAGGLEAGSIGTRGVGALHHALGDYSALVGKGLSVAEEGPIALITIFEDGAVTILGAIAADGNALALPGSALISHSTRVAIVTVGGVVREDAAPINAAGIVGAGVIIVADGGGTLADAGSAVVRYCTRIVVTALGTIQGLIGAACDEVTYIFGTVVAIVTKVHEIATHSSGFINISVTVIVDTIARFCAGHGGITRGEPGLGADPLTHASAVLVGRFTRGPEHQLNGFLRTLTGATLGHTLESTETVHGETLLAAEAGGTGGPVLPIGCALPAAETPLNAIVHAEVIDARNAGAALCLMAGFAEIGKVGNADEEKVGAAGLELLTVPPGGAFLDARDGAGPCPHVLQAETGEALLVVATGIEEATVPGLTFRDHLGGIDFSLKP